MGADCRMYSDPEYRKLDNIEFINWPSYKGEKTVSQMALRVITENKISKNQNIGGSSFGGIVASEIAQQLPVNKLILIGSTTTSARVNNLLKSLSNFSNHAPVKLVQFLVGKAPMSYNNALLKMFEETDPNFIKNMSKAIFEWSGNINPGCELCVIHGMYDKVIKPPKEPVTLIKGGHLIAMTHPKEVSSFLKNTLIIQ